MALFPGGVEVVLNHGQILLFGSAAAGYGRRGFHHRQSRRLVVFCGVFLQGALLGNIAALLVGQLDSVDSAARPVLEMLI